MDRIAALLSHARHHGGPDVFVAAKSAGQSDVSGRCPEPVSTLVDAGGIPQRSVDGRHDLLRLHLEQVV